VPPPSRRPPPLLEAALNGSRDHPRSPRSPAQLAAEARASVEAGADLVHLHAYDAAGRESIAPEAVAAAVQAVRAACPGVAVSVSTSAAIEPDPRRRLELVSAWTVLPDLVTSNQGEEGIREMCEHFLARGVGIEAGLLTVADAAPFLASGLAGRCTRVLLEPLDPDPADAVAHAAAMEEALAAAGIALPQVHHGDGIACWPVNERAVRRGHGIRTGLEDTPVLADGGLAEDNADLVRAAVEMVRRLGF
jgi:uncharacterized protein (DUF849 family)